MALPKINQNQRFELTIPSSGKKVTYRPYLVQEEKILMFAMESENINQILNAVVDTIEACINEDIDKSLLTPYDVEYIFIKLRSKSVGEVAPVGILCSECGKSNDVEIDLDTVDIVEPVEEAEKMVDLGDGMQLELAHPSYMDIANDVEAESVESAFSTMTKCLSILHTPDNRFVLADEPKEEVERLVGELTAEQLKKVKDFIAAQPKVVIDIEFKCEHCDHENKLDVEGMQSFF